MHATIVKLKSVIILALLFIFPLFFLTLTQEFYNTNKFFLLVFTTLVILAVIAAEMFTSKKISLKKNTLSLSLLLFLAAMTVSTLIAPNKIEALLQPISSLSVFACLTIITFSISSSKLAKKAMQTLSVSCLVLAVIQIIFFINPLQNISLPHMLAFLKQPGFTPLGSQIDLSIFLGFFLVYEIAELLKKFKKSHDLFDIIELTRYIAIAAIFVALILSIVAIKQAATNRSQARINPGALLSPFNTSVQTAVESLKDYKSALFGVGIGNYNSAFTKGKSADYNRTPFWQLTFNYSRSFLLHILTETGLLGLAALAFIFVLLTLDILSKRRNIMAHMSYALYFLTVLAFFPPSLPILLLFFIFIAQINSHEKALPSFEEHPNALAIDLSEYIDVVHIFIAFLIFLLVGAGVYLLGRAYTAEYVFKKSIDSLSQTNAKIVYDYQKQAISLNPYIERYRIAFSQLNLLIANSFVTQKKETLTEADRQAIAQSIQQAISEAKSVVSLNSQKSGNWENLAFIYRNIIGAAAGADTWAISSYQRAIASDPFNPLLRFNLGGLYYTLQNYAEAIKLFREAINLKPDWANFHYNVAWAYYQNRQYDNAVSEMEKTLLLVNSNSPDYQKATQELQQFKQNLSKGKEPAVPEELKQAVDLKLPQEPQATLSPKLDLQEATPEAR